MASKLKESPFYRPPTIFTSKPEGKTELKQLAIQLAMETADSICKNERLWFYTVLRNNRDVITLFREFRPERRKRTR